MYTCNCIQALSKRALSNLQQLMNQLRSIADNAASATTYYTTTVKKKASSWLNN